MTATWYNSDGLLVKYGPTEGASGAAGEYEWDGPTRYLELVIADATTLTSSDVILDYNVVVPKNARIERVEVYVETAFTSGGSATLNVGGFKTDTSAVDASGGFVAAVPVASLTAGARIVLDTGASYVGTYVGTAPTKNVYFSAKYGTAVFTAGKAYIRVFLAPNPV